MVTKIDLVFFLRIILKIQIANFCSFYIRHENGLLLGRSDFRFSIILDILYNFFHTISDISAYLVLIVINNLKKYRVLKK
jgi:hypothetical protein